MCDNRNMTTKMIQIRNVPEGLHGELRRRAKLRGKSLSDYLKDLLETEVGRPSPEEYAARLLARGDLPYTTDPTAFIRRLREEGPDWPTQ